MLQAINEFDLVFLDHTVHFDVGDIIPADYETFTDVLFNTLLTTDQVPQEFVPPVPEPIEEIVQDALPIEPIPEPIEKTVVVDGTSFELSSKESVQEPEIEMYKPVPKPNPKYRR